MLADSGTTAMDVVYLVASVGPVIVVGFLCFVFFRAARRNDEHERDEAKRRGLPPPPRAY